LIYNTTKRFDRACTPSFPRLPPFLKKSFPSHCQPETKTSTTHRIILNNISGYAAMTAASRLLFGLCLVAVVACAAPVKAAEALTKVSDTKNTRLGAAISNQQVSAAKKEPNVEVATLKPAAYRASESSGPACSMEVAT
jgi:hypothetical protein